MVRRTKAEAQATREQLLDAAERTFCDKGVAQTTLDDIARAAGVTRGAVYWHFRNKAEIFAGVCGRAELPGQALLAQLANDPGPDPLGCLKNGAVQVLTNLASCARTQSIYHVLLRRFDGNEELLCALPQPPDVERCRDMLETVLAAAIEADQLPATVDPRAAAIAFDAFMTGLMHTWIEHRDYDLAALAPVLVDRFVAGWAGAPRPGKRRVPSGSRTGRSIRRSAGRLGASRRAA